MLARLGRSAADRERALAATRRFAADAGHELRTPLTSVQATLSTLRRHPDLPTERREAMLDDALAEQRRLVDLLDGLQALARGDAGPLEHARGRPHRAGRRGRSPRRRRAIRASLSRSSCRRRRSSSTAGSRACGCWSTTSSTTRSATAATAGPRRAGCSGGPGAVLTVDDDGPGVPDDERERIFAPFARIDGVEAPGSGLASRSSRSRPATTARASRSVLHRPSAARDSPCASRDRRAICGDANQVLLSSGAPGARTLVGLLVDQAEAMRAS